MNILILSPFLPYPLTQGGKIRVFNIIKYLSRKHRITLACVYAGKNDDYGPLKEICDEIVCIERKPNIVKDLAVFLLSREPFNSVRYSSGDFISALHYLLQRKSFDLVQIEFATMWQYAGIFKGIPVVLDAHNIEYEIISQIKNTCGDPVRRILYSLEEKKLKNKEEEAWNECSFCFTVSDKENDFIASYLNRHDKVVAVPNGADLERFEFIPGESMHRRLLFLGGMDYQPNLDSALYLLNDIFPLIKAKMTGVSLDIIGRELWRIPRQEFAEGVNFHDDVPDILPYFRKADVLLVPLRQGAGTRVKILEAMASGLPVVTTSKGVEGIHAINGEHLMRSDSPAVFANAIQSVMENKALRLSLAHNARRLVEEKYSWEMLVKKMESCYEGIVR